MTVVELVLTESLSVRLTAGTSKPCAYEVVHEGETVASYETSADPRTTGGRVGVRNVVCRHVPAAEKATVEERLAAAVSDREADLTEELGPR